MKLYFDKRLSDPTYYAQQGFRRPDGKSTTRNVKIFGKRSQLLAITKDPVAYCKQQLKLLNDEYRAGESSLEIRLNFIEKVDDTADKYSKSDLMNIGYLYLQEIYQALHISDFFKTITDGRRVKFDCDLINRFLTFARILDPRSKYGTYDKMHTYFEQPDIDYHQIMRFLDILETNSSKYLHWLYKESENVIKRDSSVIYYDCTNFYFEVEQADEPIIDEITGEVLSYGIRYHGVSKENRSTPIVDMGLLMDKRGIPISMCIEPGNKSEQLTAIPLEKETIPILKTTKFIYCADAGLGSYSIRQFNAMGGRAFIVTQSIKKLSDVLKQAVFSDIDYRLLSDERQCTVKAMKEFDKYDTHNTALYNDMLYKVIPADKPIDLGLYETKRLQNGKKIKVKNPGNLKQVIIVTFSRKMFEYQQAIRQRQIERAQRLADRKDPEEIKKGPNDIRRFLKRIATTKSQEKVDIRYELDLEKIHEEEKYDGYYAVATNLIEDKAKDILAVVQRRYKIEDCFRILKTNFSARPVYHSKENRIKAHFMVCYTALLIYRLLECKLDDCGTHITADNLINTLRNMNVVDNGMYYRSTYKGSEALNALTAYSNLALDRKMYNPTELRKKFKKLSK